MASLTVSQSLVAVATGSEFSALLSPNKKQHAFSKNCPSGLLQCFPVKQLSSISRFAPSVQADENNIAFSNVSVRAAKSGGNRKTRGDGKVVPKKKESVWNDDLAVTGVSNHNRKSGGRRRQGTSPNGYTRKKKDGGSDRAPNVNSNSRAAIASSNARMLVSAAMPVETEAVLQIPEPATDPLWTTFCSSIRGVWRGVGAAFSPTTAEMEPIALGDKNENLYDSRIYSTVEERQEPNGNFMYTKTCWAVGNPYGEEAEGELRSHMLKEEVNIDKDEMSKDLEEGIFEHARIGTDVGHNLLEDSVDIEDFSSEASFDFSASIDNTQPGGEVAGQEEKWVTENLDDDNLRYENVMDEDSMELEPGIVFFEDGAYSRGPLDLLKSEISSADFMPQTFKIEQCLVKGGHTRLRLVHTIAVEPEGEEVQLLRVAIYEEEWMGPCNMKSISDMGGHHLRLFSQRERHLPKDLAGSWKVFEISATTILPEETDNGEELKRPPYVYFTEETLKQRHLPEGAAQSVNEGLLDLEDTAVMWLPGGVTAYLNMKENGILTIGVGWYIERVNLVMERDYNATGKLHEVRAKSEIKGGWVGGRM